MSRRVGAAHLGGFVLLAVGYGYGYVQLSGFRSGGAAIREATVVPLFGGLVLSPLTAVVVVGWLVILAFAVHFRSWLLTALSYAVLSAYWGWLAFVMRDIDL